MTSNKKRQASYDTDFNNFENIVELIKSSKNIVIIMGAGVSVSCGIPDFRSKDGLYNSLNCQEFGIPSAELLFDRQMFEIDPAPFYKFASALLPDDEVAPSLCHKFISLLSRKKKLLRVYTQNIDGLERRAGVSRDHLVQCHGSMEDFECINCGCKRKLDDEIRRSVKQGEVYSCKRRVCEGAAMKPRITFFGETVPVAFTKALEKDCTKKCDLVLVIGTSLTVGGSVQEVLRRIGSSKSRYGQDTQCLLINKSSVVPKQDILPRGFDASLLGECDAIAACLCHQLGWSISDVTSDSISSDGKVLSAADNPTKLNVILSTEDISKSAMWTCELIAPHVHSISSTCSLHK